MKNKIFIVLIVTVLLPVFTIAGTKDSGGDPMVQQFLDYGRKLSIFFEKNPYSIVLSFNAQDFSQIVKDLEKSIKDENLTDRIEFTDSVLHDKDGVEKPAVFNGETGIITVNRDEWRKDTPEERLIQVMLEISGLLKTPLRYENAEQMIRSRASVILSIPVRDPDTEYSGPGRQIVGTDPSIFGKIRDEKILLDMGFFGSGDEKNHQTVAFLTSPEKFPNGLFNLAARASREDGLFLQFNGIGGDKAYVSHITLRVGESSDPGKRVLRIQIYSLLFERYNQVYLGDCYEGGIKLNPLDRLNHCYLNQQVYRSYDDLYNGQVEIDVDPSKPEVSLDSEMFDKVLAPEMIKTVSELHESLLGYFSIDTDTLRAALRDHFVNDYSRALYQEYGQIALLLASAHTFGLEPTLDGPFVETAFWEKKSGKDSSAKRFYEAARALGEHGLVYVDHNIKCSPSQEGKNDGFQGPYVISKKKILEHRDCISYLMGIMDYEAGLFKAMAAYGFYYDAKAEVWILTKDQKGMGRYEAFDQDRM